MAFKTGDEVIVSSGIVFMGTGTITRFKERNGKRLARVEMDDCSLTLYHPEENLKKR